MRQCLSCSATFADGLSACVACGGQRSFVIAGTAAPKPSGSSGGGIAGNLGGLGRFFTAEGAPNGQMWCGIDVLVVEVPMVLKLLITGFGKEHLILAFAAVLSLPFAVALILQQEWARWPTGVLILSQICRHMAWFALLFAVGGLLIGITHVLATGLLVLALIMLYRSTHDRPVAAWVQGQGAAIAVYLGVVITYLVMPAGPPPLPSDLHVVNGRVTDTTDCFSITLPKGWDIERTAHGILATPPNGAEPDTSLDIELTWANAAGPMSVVQAWGPEHFFKVRDQQNLTTNSGVFCSMAWFENETSKYSVYAMGNPQAGCNYLAVYTTSPDKSAYDGDIRTAILTFSLEPGDPPKFHE